MEDSMQDRGSPRGGQQGPPDIAESNIPDTDDNWFALIEPEIDVLPEEADEDDVIEVAQHHAEQAIERTGMAVDLELVTWRATRELRVRHGYHRNDFIKLSMNSLETNGWQQFVRTVRHELVHAWQYQNDVDDRPAKNTFERFHGPSFEQWMPILNIAKRGGHILPRWRIECPECEAILDKKQRARDKEIAQRIQTLGEKVCYRCDHELSELTVKRDGYEIAAESLPDVLSAEQDQIFLYNETATTSQSDEHETDRQTRRLTAFTGIGEETARKLGDDITRIDELLDVEDGTLTAEVQSAVSAQYHDRLREEVRDWYQKSLNRRSPDELDPIDEKCLTGNVDWTHTTKDIDVTDDPKLMCVLLRDGTDPTDQLRITTEEYGDLTVQIVEKADGEQTEIRVTIEPASTPLGAEGIIEIPAPYRGKYPVMRDRQDLSDPHPSPDDSSNISFYKIHRRKITEVARHTAR